MTAARDPRDLIEVFGPIWASKDDKLAIGMPFAEVEMRRNLASAAHACGWLVEEEVFVPDWGRIDLILRDGASAPLLIELKLDLTRPAQIRKAFQQTDGYGRWWVQEYGEAVDTLLVGLKVDPGGMSSVHRAYPHVGWCAAGSLLGKFVSRGGEEARRLRGGRTATRLKVLQNIASAYEVALRDLPCDPEILSMFSLPGAPAGGEA